MPFEVYLHKEAMIGALQACFFLELSLML